MPTTQTATATTNHMSRYTAILQDLRAGILDLQFLAHKHHLSHLQMARFVMKPRHARIIREVAALARHSADLLLTSARATAARALRRAARRKDADHADSARKAGADLLRAANPTTRPTRAAPPPSPTPQPPAPSPDDDTRDYNERARRADNRWIHHTTTSAEPRAQARDEPPRAPPDAPSPTTLAATASADTHHAPPLPAAEGGATQ